MSQTNKNQPFPMPWPDFFLALPRSVCQSAVFGVSYRRGRRPAFDGVELFSWADRRVFFSGFGLDQFDLDVWLFCLDFAKSSNSNFVSLTRRQICRGLQICGGKKEITRVENSLFRLFSATLKIKEIKKEPLFFSLLESAEDVGDKGKLNIGFAPHLLKAMTQPVFLDRGRRAAINLPLAKKLHVIFSSQSRRKNHSLKIKKLIFLAAQEAVSEKEFRRKLKAAMAELAEVGVIDAGWRINLQAITYKAMEIT